ncbi:hypothetical protein HY637_03280 [Candidatus Woesearchaeota archaeon]|nr:hypothetical protein [Candidatus Woesearchaeota archaeon]
MEIKNLILLLTIPILLIVALFSLGKIPPITGAATAEEANQKLGEYSITPSFKAKIDYNIEEEYGKLKTELKKIIDECKSQENMEDCINKKISENTEIQWKCDEKDTDVLYDFVDKLKDCIKIQQENVMCRFSFDRKDHINRVKSQRTFEIRLTNWYPPNVKAELFEDGKWLATEFIELGKLTYSDDMKNPTKDVNSIVAKIMFNEGTPTVQEIYASTDASPRVELSKLFLLYKSKKNEADGEDVANVHFIDLSVEGNFRGSSSKAINLPITKGTKFCAKTAKQVLAYDNSDSAVKMRDIEYRFAVTFPKTAPKPLDDLLPLDGLKAENAAILSWSKPKDNTIDSYSIYYSENDFSNKKIQDIKKDENIRKISAEIENLVRIDKIDLTRCGFDPAGSPCKYGDYENSLAVGRLYYSKSDNKFIYLIKDSDLTDGKQYYFAVTAVNSQGEISNDKSIQGNTYILSEGKNYARFTPADDLAPGKAAELGKIKTPEGKTKLAWKRPSKNTDGSEANDVAGYRIYYKRSLSDINPQLEPGHEIKQITAADAKCDTISLYCEYIVENIAGLEKGQPYSFAVIPIDEVLPKANEYNLESDRVSVQIG